MAVWSKKRREMAAMAAAPAMVAANIHQIRQMACRSYFKHFLSI